jgi:N4-gp56 family major capsid protein
MAEDTTNVWSGTANFDKMLQTLIRLQLEEQLRNPLPYMLNSNYVPANLVRATGKNGTVRFLAIGDLAVDVSDGSGLWVVTEGEPNDSEDLDFGYEEFSVRQGMRTVKITDVAEDESPIALVPVAAEKLARVLLEVANAIAAKTLIAGTNTYFVGGDSNPTNAEVQPQDILTGAVVRNVVSELEVGLVPTFADQFYRAFLHPYVKLDLSGDAGAGGWIDAAKYNTSSALLTGEIGQYGGVKFIRSIVGAKVADAGASSNDVYVTPFIGPGAFAIGDFGRAQTFFTPPGGHDDPGHQSALVTVKGYWGGMVIGEGTNASGPVSAPRYINVHSAVSKSAS